ncbi:MAG: DNA/RNA nuclease SfsA [Sandaracinaceae bacterium]
MGRRGIGPTVGRRGAGDKVRRARAEWRALRSYPTVGDPVLAFLPHPTPLLEGTLVARHDRFLADVRLPDGRLVVAWCVNPGQMEGMVRSGARVWLSRVPPSSPRKLRYTWELVELDGVIVGANTSAPNRIARALLEARSLPGLKRYRGLRSEVQDGAMRVDFRVEQGGRPHLVEIKNCHLVYPDGRGYFPDTVSERASRHLGELAARAEDGAKATVLFTVQHPGARALRPSALHDPAFAGAARAAADRGVRIRAVEAVASPEGYAVTREIPVDLRPYDAERLAAYREANRPWSGWERRGARRGPPSRAP